MLKKRIFKELWISQDRHFNSFLYNYFLEPTNILVIAKNPQYWGFLKKLYVCLSKA